MEEKKTPAERLGLSKNYKPRSPSKLPNGRKTPWDCSLRTLRKSSGLTIDDVAKEIGISRQGYWEIEQGGDPMHMTARKLSEFFGKSTDDIWRLRGTDSEAEGGV